MSKKKKRKKEKKIQGAVLKPARGKLSSLRFGRRKTDVHWTSCDLDRLTELCSVLPPKAENKKYNIKENNIMSKNGKGCSGNTHTQSQMNHHANQCNPNNSAHTAAMNNHANQCNPNHNASKR